MPYFKPSLFLTLAIYSSMSLADDSQQQTITQLQQQIQQVQASIAPAIAKQAEVTTKQVQDMQTQLQASIAAVQQ